MFADDAQLLPNDIGVQRRAGEGAQRPTRPAVCNGRLDGHRGTAGVDPLQVSGHILYTFEDAIGLEPVDDGLWNIVYYNTLLGRLSERTGKISGASFLSEKC